MNDLNEARRNLEAVLGEDLKKKYFGLLKGWFLFTSDLSKLEFDSKLRELMVTDEQIRQHNHFLLALFSKVNNARGKSARNTSDKGCFEFADYTEYFTPPSPTYVLPADIENRSAAAELFLPDSGFIATRIAITCWEHGLESAEDGVTEIIVYACQAILKNIVTAMIARTRGYKIRDGKFQHGFGLPVPDPYIRNTNLIIDHNQDSKVEVSADDDSFVPACRPTLESAEQQTAFSYSCGKQRKTDEVKLTMQLLYDTIRENPRLLILHSIHSVNLLKTSLALEDA